MFEMPNDLLVNSELVSHSSVAGTCTASHHVHTFVEKSLHRSRRQFCGERLISVGVLICHFGNAIIQICCRAAFLLDTFYDTFGHLATDETCCQILVSLSFQSRRGKELPMQIEKDALHV